MLQYKQFGKRILGSIDMTLTVLTVTAALLGIIAIFSATYSMGTYKMVIIQSCAFVLGVVAMLAISRVDYELWSEATKLIFAGNVILLVLVLFIGMGRDTTGTRGWIDLGIISFQPAEIVKLGFILTFAHHLERVKNDVNYIPTLLLLTLHMAVPVGLILLQPDAGTAMVFVFIFLSMLFAAGLSYKYIAAGAGAFVVAAPIFWYFKESFLSQYQINRFLAFFNPYLDPTDSGYNVIQSAISVGSGKFTGKGYLQGSQNQFGYLPAKHTDFIFATIGEEWGFIGALAVVVLLTLIIIRCIYVAMKSEDSYGSLICVGIGSMLAFHVLENIGMCLLLMPVTGIPLPFFSYGGSSLLTNFMAIGFVNSVGSRCRKINF
mgnify:CR=1 FL=1